MPRRIRLTGNPKNASKLAPVAKKLLKKLEEKFARLNIPHLTRDVNITAFGSISLFVNAFKSVAICRGIEEGGLGQFIFSSQGIGSQGNLQTLFRYDAGLGEFVAIATPPWSVLPSLPILSVLALGYNPTSGYLYIMENNFRMHCWNNQSEGWLSRTINYDGVPPTSGIDNRPRISFAHGNMYFSGQDNTNLNGPVLWCVPGAGGSTIPSSFDVDDTVSYGQADTELNVGLADHHAFGDYLYVVCEGGGTNEPVYKLSDDTTVLTPQDQIGILRLDSDNNWEEIPAATILALTGYSSFGCNTGNRLNLIEYNGALYAGPGSVGATTSLFDVIFRITGSDTTVEVSTTNSQTGEQFAISSGGIYLLDEVSREVDRATGSAWSFEFDYDMNTSDVPLMFPFDDELVMLGDFDNVDAVTGGSQYFYNPTDGARLINPDLNTSSGAYEVTSAIRLPVSLTFDNFEDVW